MKEGEVISSAVYGPYLILALQPYAFKHITRIDGKAVAEELQGRYTMTGEVKKAIKAYHAKAGLPQIEGDLEFTSPFDTEQERQHFQIKLNQGKHTS